MTGPRWRSSSTPRPQLASPRDRYAYFPGHRGGARGAGGERPQPRPSRSGRWWTSPLPARRACCSRTGRGSAGTPCTSRTTGCTTSTTSSAWWSRRSTAPRTSRPGENLILSASFDKDGEDPPHVSTGILSLYHGDKKVGEGRIRTQPGMFSARGRGPVRRPRQRRAGDRRLPGRAPARVHRRHDQAGRGRRQRRPLRRPRARGPGHAGPRVTSRAVGAEDLANAQGPCKVLGLSGSSPALKRREGPQTQRGSTTESGGLRSACCCRLPAQPPASYLRRDVRLAVRRPVRLATLRHPIIVCLRIVVMAGPGR